MVKQYGVLTMCQDEIESSNLPVIDKLKIRMLLIQTKRLLLNGDVSARVRDDGKSEREFEELYDYVRHVCSPASKARELDDLIMRLVTIKEDLEMPPED